MVECGKKNRKDDQNEIDYILNDIGGTFGKFQIYNYLMLSYSMLVTGTYIYDYVFSALEIDHRCSIPECEQFNDDNNVIFNPNWLQYSTPFKNDHPDSCHRFDMIYDVNAESNACNNNAFNRSVISYCGDGPMIYRTNDVSIVNEFNLTCDENRWKLAMVGTYSNIGRFIFLSLVGYLSDRFGRKRVLVGSTMLSSLIKVCKSFATNYNTFVMFEVLDAGICSAIYPASLILGMEWATSEHHILVTCIVLASYPFGAVITALIAVYLHNFKWMLRVLSIFGFLTFPSIWAIPESFRWLLVNRKYDEAIKVVEKAAKINGLDVSPKTYGIILTKCQHGNNGDEMTHNEPNNGSFIEIIQNCTLFSRLVICALCWVIGTFVQYGVSIISVSLPGDKYINFLVVSLGATPGIFLTYFMLKYLGRRWSMCASLLITGVSILASKLLSSHATLSLVFFFMGKLFIHHSFTSLYLYTNEMWPTVFRHRVMGICSTIGRFGSITAPLTPLLVGVMEMLPFYLFSGFACFSAILILFLPETFRQEQLPDSIDDIKKFRKKQQQQQYQQQQRP